MLGNKFDHGAESIMPTLLNLVPNSAKVMATSGVAAIRLIIRVSACLCCHAASSHTDKGQIYCTFCAAHC